MKNAFATRVGTTALPMTVATRCEYCGRDLEPDGEERCDEREPDPEGSRKPHVLHLHALPNVRLLRGFG
jgi:hypothetical protein